MGHASDAELVLASLDEPALFGELFDRHAPALLRFLVRRVGPDAAEGLLGELFRVAFEGRAAFDPERGEARPWLYGIGANLLRKHRRTEARRLRACAALARAGDAPADEGAVIGAVDARSLLPRVAEAVASLPDAERDALLLFAWEDLGYEAIAAAQGVPVGTVRSRLHRARGRLRERTASGATETAVTKGRMRGGDSDA